MSKFGIKMYLGYLNLKSMMESKKGQSGVEYAIIIAVVALVIIGFLSLFVDGIKQELTDAASKMGIKIPKK